MKMKDVRDCSACAMRSLALTERTVTGERDEDGRDGEEKNEVGGQNCEEHDETGRGKTETRPRHQSRQGQRALIMMLSYAGLARTERCGATPRKQASKPHKPTNSVAPEPLVFSRLIGEGSRSRGTR
eukprot:1950815-Rhodomonas_salina.1